MTQLTFNTAQINDAARPDGRLWEVGTLRVFHKGDRQYWSVCQKGCDNYSTALNCWGADGGEFFDGAQWRPLAQWTR